MSALSSLECTEDVVLMLETRWRALQQSLPEHLRALLQVIAREDAAPHHHTCVVDDGSEACASLDSDLCRLRDHGLVAMGPPRTTRAGLRLLCWHRTVLGEYVVARLKAGDAWT